MSYFQPGIPSRSVATNPPATLRVGSFPVETKDVTLLAGVVYQRGHVLGKITSGANAGKWTVSTVPPVGGSDGSDVPAAILEFDVDTSATGSDADTPANVAVTGEFDAAQLVYGATYTAATVKAALEASKQSLFLLDVAKTY